MNRFKKIELELDGLTRKARQSFGFDIATRVVSLVKDAEAYADAIGINVDDVAEHVASRFLADFPIGLEELTIIVEHLPRREQWDKPLIELYQQVVREVRAATPRAERAPAARATRKQLEEAMDRAKSAESEAKHLREQLSGVTEENRRLLRENARLEGRISELERIVARDLATT